MSANRLLTGQEVLKMARDIWLDTGGPPIVIEVDDTPGYEINTDLAWQMRLRVCTLGRDLTCYLQTLDLVGKPEILMTNLVRGWREAFWHG